MSSSGRRAALAWCSTLMLSSGRRKKEVRLAVTVANTRDELTFKERSAGSDWRSQAWAVGFCACGEAAQCGWKPVHLMTGTQGREKEEETGSHSPF